MKRWAALCLLLLISPEEVPAQAAPPAQDAPSTVEVRFVGWRGSAFGQQASGFACWIELEDGGWRAEAMLTREGESGVPGYREALLRRIGEGWTVSAPDPATLMVQPWGGPLRRPGPEELRALRLLRLVVADYGAPDGGSLPAGASLDGSGSDYRLLLPVLSGARRSSGATAFRAAMERRGRGRGAAIETWSVNRDGPLLEIRSSRRSGLLQVETLAGEPAAGYADEMLLPLWPLEDLLEFRLRSPSVEN